MSALVLRLLAGGAFVAFAAFAVVSVRERERRAALVSLTSAIVIALPLWLAAELPSAARTGVVVAFAGVISVAVVLLLLPVGRRPRPGGRPQLRVDERDIMFARARLQPGSPEYAMYYELRPENRAGDDRMRSLPGLLSLDAEKADPLAFAAAQASFDLTETVRDAVDGPVAAEQSRITAVEMTRLVERLARYWGAVSVGVTELRPYHVYTHVGRGSGDYGAPVTLQHRWAVAFTVEMSHDAISCAPEAPAVMESARQYVEATKIAILLANTIRRLGFASSAHIDGNYRVIAPLVARDAGLGEIGRMGLLMTPELGPRVRLGVVTTDAPLEAAAPTDEPSVIDFCAACRKCEQSCPTAAISAGDREPVGDGLRWAINSEACFRYWQVIGTDCARCVRVCPYSHPDNLAHNAVRWATRRSVVARRVLLWMDDLFYGRSPATRDGGPLSG